MSYLFEKLPDSDVLTLSLKGPVDREQLRDARLEMRRIIHEGGVKCTLIDMRSVDWDLLTIDLFKFGTTIEAPKDMRTAIVCRKDDADARFLCDVVRNRGWWLKVFTDYTDAVEALKL